MKGITQYPRFTIATGLLVAGIFLLTQCVHQEQKDNAPDQHKDPDQIPKGYFEKFTGSASCASCHKKIYDTHIHTAHYLTSRPANEKYIAGSFQPGKNNFVFTPVTSISMEKKDSGYYQVEYENGIATRMQRFDIVVGSGTKGQSYASWSHNRLVQMPITYFTAAGEWSNSPGYPDKPAFNRPITSRCLECHSTYFQVVSPSDKEPETFDHQQIVYGVDCEKCHGPAAEHVAFHSGHPQERTGKYILDPASFTRQQSLDLCALCHGGRLSKTQPSFSFRAGDTLSKYFAIAKSNQDAANIDVHGNQYGLLAGSKCFQMSTMTCYTCHNTHANEHGLPEVFSQRCMTCHNSEKGHPCKMTAAIGRSISQNCIDCHMPLKASRAIAVLLQGAEHPTLAHMRTHLIKIYPDETQKFINSRQRSGQSKNKR